MDAFLANISHHATNYAIRSCLALTSTYVVQQGSRLLKTVDDEPLHAELSHLQRRLARKVELISPIIDIIEFRYTRGDSTLEAIVRTARELRDDIDGLAKRLENAAQEKEATTNGVNKTHSLNPAARRAQLLSIITDTKELIINIDDSVPLINMWVSAIGGIQAHQPSSFSPSRLLQASMLVNVGDSQYILDPSEPMQIGPDFTLSLYMLFRGHASLHESEEPYGVEDGQRKPMWQEAIHKARVRLYRIPPGEDSSLVDGEEYNISQIGYSYRIVVVEDLDDGRVHSFDNGDTRPNSYDGIRLAGIREFIPVGQISKLFYADVGKILNIHNEEGASSSPVLLLKRDVGTLSVNMVYEGVEEQNAQPRMIENIDDSTVSDKTLSDGDSQDDIDRQLLQESKANKILPTSTDLCRGESEYAKAKECWKLPQDLDPEWIALEVFEADDDDTNSTDEDDEPTPGDAYNRSPRQTKLLRPSVDSNLVTQLSRMNLASSSRPSSRGSHAHPPHHPHPQPNQPEYYPPPPSSTELSTRLIERSPFGAIRTSLSLLEMLLRLTSLQEFEQTTHLAIPDNVLQFYLDESASTTGLRGRERRAAAAEAEAKLGFDPHADAPVG